ncbi:glycosyltransferase family 2 protein [Oceanirhabdus sp. W0125-5]|uniref:glycosyltransferase family 2 protein n=1 Tax=Oceanirhabdus sp. W0125-5 TaxID=2999116 RepID=UPI0022F2C32B|nr:glycosyltransferase [Oceanirhabdus sp. W0125-5]WBW98616.1 glycosyltransferase [Oceanirhabdus sp. W0125-5]
MSEISIVVPVYNVERYLRKCISSILEQSFKDFELILVDDGSTDNSGRICDEYKEKDSRIKVIHQENSGLSAARNIGIQTSEGKYITFIDSDDFIHPNMLEVLYNNLHTNKADISICDYNIVYEDKEVTKEFSNNNTKVYSNIEAVKKIVEKSKASMIVACGKLYRRNLFCDIRYPVGKYHEDEFVTYKLLYKSTKVVVTDAKLYYYLQRSNSITGSTYSIKRLEKLEALEEGIKFFKNEENNELTYLAEFRYLFNIQIAYYRVKYEMNYNKEIMDKLKIQYNQKFREFTGGNIKNISIIRRMLLRVFYIFPNIYCGLVRAYRYLTKFRGE